MAKRGRVLKRMSQRKTGTTKAKDKKLKAKKAGVRVSKSGNVYTERRENRSDKRKYL